MSLEGVLWARISVKLHGLFFVSYMMLPNKLPSKTRSNTGQVCNCMILMNCNMLFVNVVHPELMLISVAYQFCRVRKFKNPEPLFVCLFEITVPSNPNVKKDIFVHCKAS